MAVDQRVDRGRRVVRVRGVPCEVVAHARLGERDHRSGDAEARAGERGVDAQWRAPEGPHQVGIERIAAALEPRESLTLQFTPPAPSHCALVTRVPCLVTPDP